MTSTLWDSTTPSQIPTTAPIVAGYIDGAFAWSAADWHRLEASQHVTISVFGNQGARVLDVENMDATATQAARWAQVELDAGRRPTLYSSISTWTDEIQPALAAIGEFPAALDWWCANPTGTPQRSRAGNECEASRKGQATSSDAKRRAQARPMPFAAPVTMATLPFSRVIFDAFPISSS